MTPINNVLIIYNPVSGTFIRRHRDQEYIKKFFQQRNIRTKLIKTKANDFLEIEKEINKNYDRILVAGGDGTIQQVAHHLIKQQNKTPLGILPAGTMNFFALALGIPLAQRLALNYFIKHDPIDLDAGLVNNEKYFLIACGIGYDAKFIKNTKRKYKKLLGPLAYFIIALKHSYHQEKIQGTLTINNKTQTISFSSLIAFNVRSMLSRRKNIIYKVHPGVLDIMIIKAITVPNALKLTHKILFRNRPQYQDVELVQARELKFVSARKFLYEIDGETLAAKKLDIKIIPNALKIISRQ